MGLVICSKNKLGSELDKIKQNKTFPQHEKATFFSHTESFFRPTLIRVWKSRVYFRYVDDSLVIFGSELVCGHFQEKLNLLHPALIFTIEKEQNSSFTFLDALVDKEGTRFFTSIYRIPTFTGQYIRWNSLAQRHERSALFKP